MLQGLQARLPTRYRLIEEVGQGGMAVVYRAQDEALKREVAVKVLHGHLLSEIESKTRLQREAQAVAKLHHDNIVQIFDYSGSDSDESYLVTEFIDGQTLKQFIVNRKPPPPEVAALIAIEVGSALVHAHSLGIIHRDVKPENVMVRKDGMLKLMDFGVAQIMDLERMTVTGQLLGSPAYMAPEILEGKTIDVRTDVFSVGIMLYQLSTGALPFTGRNPHEVLKRIAEGRFADPRTLNRLVADRLAKIIARALAKAPDDRYPTMAGLLVDLQPFVADAGLIDARAELKGYFSDPTGYEKAVVPRMVSALVARGTEERAARRTARALELWNRALAMDPSNKEVLAELRRLETRQHVKRGTLVVASVAVLAAGVVFALGRAAEEPAPRAGLTGLGRRSPPSAPAKTQVLATTGETRLPSRSSPSSPGPAAHAEAHAAPARAVAPPPHVNTPRPVRPAAVHRTLTLAPYPGSAEISIDGEPQPSFNPGHNTIEVDWSRDHELLFRNPCCFPKRVTVGPNADPPPDDRVVVRFQGIPASVVVETDPPLKGRVGVFEQDAEDGVIPVNTMGNIGERISVSFKDDSDMRKTLLLTIAPDGRPARNQRIEIKANETKMVPVKLDDQRP